MSLKGQEITNKDHCAGKFFRTPLNFCLLFLPRVLRDAE
jgi:hypothetical protein